MGGSSKAVSSAIGIGEVDASPKFGSKRSLADGALIVANDPRDWMLCFVRCNLMHGDVDKGVGSVSAFVSVFKMMIASVDGRLCLAKSRFMFLKDELIGRVSCSN